MCRLFSHSSRSQKAVSLIAVAVVTSAVVVATLVSAAVPPPTLESRRTQAAKLMQDGNFREAYDAYRATLLDPAAGGEPTLPDLQQAVACLNNLGEVSKFDELVEAVLKAHPTDWRVMSAVATQYQTAQPYGFIVSGKFERGGHRGGGDVANSRERDRVRALQLFVGAAKLADLDDKKRDVGVFYKQFAAAILPAAGAQEAWRMTAITELSELPDYEQGYPGGRDFVGVPCDAEGKPVFWTAAKSWDTAKNDGQRWRWALAMATENDSDVAKDVKFETAGFLQALYGVQTMQSMRFGWNPWGVAPDDETQDDAAKKTFLLDTLKTTETLAKTARGIQRFDLPAESNYITLWQEIAKSDSVYAEQSMNNLVGVFLNRRQYETAAQILRESLKRFATNDVDGKKRRLAQIVDGWGQFEPVQTLPAGAAAVLPFRFRNAKSVELVAKQVNVEKLLADVQTYLKTSPARLDWQKIQIENLGWQIMQGSAEKYVGAEAARWTVPLEPRENHFDRLIEIESPLKKPGAFLITATMAGGHESSILVWIADTAIVRKPLSEQNLYYVADAVTGQPVGKATVNFFGYRQEHLGDGKFRTLTREFTETASADGIVIPDARDLSNEYQWIVTARGIGDAKGRFAYLGFDSVWSSRYFDAEYEATKVFTMTDRPVYRPEQTVHFKAWLRHAQYDQEDVSQFGGASCTVTIHDPRGTEIYKKTLTADPFGGVEGELALPGEATLGVYPINFESLPVGGRRLQANGGNSFRVEEYKKPEFEVTIDAPTDPVMLGEKVTAKVTAKYYFGSPVTNATVKLKVLRNEHDANWYPYRPWDWCYGPGYWWFAYDYAWYPGWEKWHGCVRPLPWWGFQADRDPPEVVIEQDVPIGEDGTVSLDIDTSVAKAMFGNHDHKYTVTAEVRDESRRTIVGSGTVLVARKPFTVYTWLDRGYFRVGDRIGANFLAQTLDQKPVQGTGTLVLYKIGYDKDKTEPTETEVNRWELKTDEQGRAETPIKAAEAGQYRLSYTVIDDAKHSVEGGFIFSILGDAMADADFRFNALELIPDKETYQAGEKVKLQINSNKADATVLLFVRPSNGVYLPPQVVRLKGKTTVVEFPITKKDMPNFFVEAVTVADGHGYDEAREIIVPPESRVLTVNVEPNQKEYKPGQPASVNLHLTDATGENFEGSCVVTIYDKSVEYIAGGSNVPDIREFFWKWRRSHQPYRNDTLNRSGMNLTKPNVEAMSTLGVFGDNVAIEGLLVSDSSPGNDRGVGTRDSTRFRTMSMARGGGMGGGMGGFAAPMAAAPMMMKAARADGPASDAMEMTVGDMAEAGVAGGGGGEMVEATVRSNFADTALWVGRIETDKTGRATVQLDMPESLTAWKIHVWSMGHGTKVGHGEAEVVTRKDLLIRMQTPRFFVQNDEVVLTANVHNYLDSEKMAQVVLEVPSNVIANLDDLKRDLRIPAGGEVRVDWRVRIVGEGDAKIVMKALTDEESDAMEMTIPSKVHGLLKTESWAGTLRPDKESALVTINVPEERRPEQTVLEVRFSPTLAAAMVDALPYLANYPYGCTEQTLNRFLPSAITKKTLQTMGVDLADVKKKRTNLNAQEIGDATERAEQWKRYEENPVFDEAELDQMIAAGVERLKNMQVSDGGWGWFSGTGEQSYAHTTAVVVHGLLVARDADVALPDGMLDRGIEWLAKHADEQVVLIKNFGIKDKPSKRQADNLDAFVCMILTEAGRDNADLRGLCYKVRNDLAVYAKACLALAYQAQGDAESVAMLRRNIEQFLVVDEENETAYLKLPENNYWWNWYGSEIEADAFYLKLLTKIDGGGNDCAAVGEISPQQS